jgi:hypothetical protein
MTRYESKMVISESTMQMALTDDEIKNTVKRQLAYELAKNIIESKKPIFTYTKNPNDFTSTIKIVVDL